MIDIHCHILPGVDDGAQDLEESIAMARLAYNDGIRHIIATPHFNGKYNNHKDIVAAKTDDLQKMLAAHQIDITIHPGNEVRLENKDAFYSQAEHNEFCYLDANRRFVLLEQRWTDYDTDTPEVIDWLKARGTTLIIPHPERHPFFREHPNLIVQLIQAGAWTQVSVDSLLGRNSEEAKQFALWLIDNNYAHTLATDAHNTRRKPNLSEGYHLVAARLGQTRADEIHKRCRQIIEP